MQPLIDSTTPTPGESAPATAPNATAPNATARFNTGQVMTVAGAHFIHDTYSAFIAPLLPLIQARLGIGFALAGGLAVFAQLPSILNPFIGYIADKVSVRYFIIVAPAVTGILLSLMGVATSYTALALLLLLGGVSIAAFHAPAPALVGRLAGNRIGTGMSIFMAAGELGRAVGPVAVASGVLWFGLEGLWRLAIIGILTSVVLYYRLHNLAPVPASQLTASSALLKRARRIFPALASYMLARCFLLAALTTFLPSLVFFSEGTSSNLLLSAGALTLLEAAGVVGALLTGTASDWLGRRTLLLLSAILAPPLLLLFLNASPFWAVPLLIALGLTAISPTPVLLAIVQDNFPDNRALANGSFLALNFLIRALGIWAIGRVADLTSLETAFFWGAIIALLSAPALAFLPKQIDLHRAQ